MLKSIIIDSEVSIFHSSQIAVIRNANVGILLDYCWTNVDKWRWRKTSFCSSGRLYCFFSPTSPAYANVMPTILFKYCVWPTLVRHDFRELHVTIFNSLDKPLPFFSVHVFDRKAATIPYDVSAVSLPRYSVPLALQ